MRRRPPPIDYVDDYVDLDEPDDEPMPLARPLFGLVEIALLASLVALAGVCLWIGLTWQGRL